MRCGTGECGCGCGELSQIHVKPATVVKFGVEEGQGEQPKSVPAGVQEPSDRSRG